MAKAKRSGFPQMSREGSVKDMNYQGNATDEFLPVVESVDALDPKIDMSPNDGDNKKITNGPVPFANEKDKRVGR
jgi:hypothetical protein